MEILFKQKNYNDLWMDWENHLWKNSIRKIKKTVRMKAKMPHENQKPLSRKRNFVHTLFSHYLKIRMEKFHAAKPLAFSVHLLFWLPRVDFKT